ncbi:di-heme-cytochrome C peroxidase [Marinagarivorans algicola]|uniref:di-heme-cytochrome C peroxidase n=1 Tax=Marinagarivorans algicola TaxID=1513270 RepID=UPI0037350D2E
MLRALFRILRTVKKGAITLLIVLTLAILWAATLNKPSQHLFPDYGLPSTIRTLPQNWTPDIRQQVAHTSFGSHILPLQWLLHLEHPTLPNLINDPDYLSTLGFIPQQHSINNPYALPIGFSVTDHKNEQWAGLTCAACHTALVSYKGQKILIDGGSAQLNFAQFEQDILAAITHTLDQPARLARFADALHSDETPLKVALEHYQQSLERRLTLNATSTPYGHGRLDALGIIFNTIAAEALNMPANAHSPDGPVSIPTLWDASHHDLVQWNGSAPNQEPGPLAQNIPTALAVYGSVDIDPDNIIGYRNSVNVKNLGYLQQQYYKLTRPKWPSELLGAIDARKAFLGKTLYRTHCQDCHTIIDPLAPKRKIKSVLVDIARIGTDPVMATNFVERQVHSGQLQGEKMGIVAGPPIAAQVPPIELVMNATAGVILNKPLSAITAVATEYASNFSAPLAWTRKAYRARPLNGIWSSAPYLHNGSVPTLWDLLQPPELRAQTFYVGNQELDLIKVGFQHHQNLNASYFDTTLYGNSNSGHLFGTHLTEGEKWALIEYLKTL